MAMTMDSKLSVKNLATNKILLIDDQAIFIKSITKLLETWGYQVTSFTSPLEAVDSLKKA